MEEDLKFVIEACKEGFIRFGYSTPMLYIAGSWKKSVLFIEEACPTIEDKVNAMVVAGLQVASTQELGDVQYVMLTFHALTNLVPNSEHDTPLRLEALHFATLDVPTETQALTMYQIERDNKNNFVAFREVKGAMGAEIWSPLLTAFLRSYRSFKQ